MQLETFFLLICTFAFFVVSIALAGKFVMDAYLDYLQVKEGIEVMRQSELQEMMKSDNEEDEDGPNRFGY
jgi:hypothetical protein